MFKSKLLISNLQRNSRSESAGRDEVSTLPKLGHIGVSLRPKAEEDKMAKKSETSFQHEVGTSSEQGCTLVIL